GWWWWVGSALLATEARCDLQVVRALSGHPRSPTGTGVSDGEAGAGTATKAAPDEPERPVAEEDQEKGSASRSLRGVRRANLALPASSAASASRCATFTGSSTSLVWGGRAIVRTACCSSRSAALAAARVANQSTTPR